MNVVYQKKLPFSRALTDTWYATRHLMLTIEEMGKLYYCPLKKNRLVDDSGGTEKYKRIEDLSKTLGTEHWSETELTEGKTIKIEQFHRDLKQVMGLERCQCNHIASKTGKTVYQLKQGLLDEYIVQQLRNPAIKMADA